jgi:hypothetical protein
LPPLTTDFLENESVIKLNLEDHEKVISLCDKILRISNENTEKEE